MKKLFVALSVSACMLLGTASADTIANAVGNTLNVATPDGGSFRYHFETNGTYTMVGPDQQSAAGAWVVNGDQICLTPQGQAQQCYPYDGSKKVGDTWTMTAQDGGVVTLSLTQGR
jgi:hypothetical protein